jgi:hypothetical protein
MATVNLTTSGGNDTSAIQSAIDAANVGDTLDFGAGDYHLDGVTLKSGVTYHGEAGAVLHATGSNPVFSVDSGNSHDITIDSLSFVGTGADPTSGVVDLAGTGAAGSVDHIVLSNSSFENNGLTFDFVKNSQIVDDHFSNIHGVGTGIHGYHMDSSTIGGNVFTNDYQGIGLVFGGAENQGHNVVVDSNVGTGMSRMGIEIIGSDPVYPGETTNLLVHNNYFSDWGTPSADGETTAYSIVTDGGTGTQITGNYAQNSLHSGYGIEMAGVGATADGNYIDGFSTGVIGYSSRDVIQNNNIINNSSDATSTYTQTDEIMQNNTSDPSLAHPAQPSGWDHAVASSTAPAPLSAPSSDPAAGSSPASAPASASNSSTASVASGHDAFVVPTTAASGSAATHAAAGTDLLDPTTPLGAAHHAGAGAAGHHVVDTAFHGDGGAASALGDGAAATHSDMTLHHLLPTAHAHADYVWHS